MPTNEAGGSRFRAAVVDALLARYQPAASPDVASSVRRFVSEQLGRAPVYVRAGVEVVEALLVASTLLRGRRFVRLPAGDRVGMIERWEASRLPPVHAYLKLIRSLVLFCAYELQPRS